MSHLSRSPAVQSRHESQFSRLDAIQKSLTTLSSTTPRNKAELLDEALQLAKYFANECSFAEAQFQRASSETDSLRWSRKQSMTQGSDEEVGSDLDEQEDLRKISDDIASLEKEMSSMKGIVMQAAANASGSSAAPSTSPTSSSISSGISQLVTSPSKKKLPSLNSRVGRLLETKAAKLEDLLALYRKRLAQFSEIQGLGGEIVAQYGSISSMFDAISKLRKENEVLRQREIRWSVNSLIKRRNLKECDQDFLRVLVIALQSELAATLDELEQVRKARPHIYGQIKHVDIGLVHDLEDIGVDDDDEEKVTIPHRLSSVDASVGAEYVTRQSVTPTSGVRHSDQQWLVQKLATAEHSNQALHAQLRFMEAEVDKVRSFISQNAETAFPPSSPQVEKDFAVSQLSKRVRQLNHQVDALLEDVNRLHQTVLAKQKEIDLQQEIIAQQGRDRASQESLLAEALHRIDLLSKRNNALGTSLSRSQHANRVLHATSTALSHALWGQSPRDRGLVNDLLSDSMRVYGVTVRAVIRIQAWARGWKARRQHQSAFSRNSSFASQQASSVRRETVSVLSPRAEAAAAPVKPLPPKEKSETMVLSSLDVYGLLLETLISSQAMSHRRTAQEQSHIVSSIVQGLRDDLRRTVQKDLDHFRKLLLSDAQQLMEGWRKSLNYPRVERASYTGDWSAVERSSQSEAPTTRDFCEQTVVEDAAAAAAPVPAKKK
eukprot:ANDGO_03823.mRNA.1 hypothetical protein